MEIGLVIGTRPEAIKLAPVALELAATGRITPRIITTGQHGAVVDEILDLFGLHADVALDLERGERSPVELSSRLLHALDGALAGLDPAAIVVQGDTVSAAMGAYAGFQLRIPVVHVEAGLRTADLHTPFPEEGNRRLIGRLADLHLAPTRLAAANLYAEGVPAASVEVTGNTVIDALLHTAGAPVPYGDQRLEALDAEGLPLVTVTAHRRESWGEPIRDIARAVRELAETFPKVRFAVVTHMNPEVQATVRGELEGVAGVVLAEPLGYAAFTRLLTRSALVITDSGGVQEEAPALGVPVLVTREETERVEALEAGTAKLVGTGTAAIVAEATTLLTDPAAREIMSPGVSPYGDGKAAKRTVDAIESLLGVHATVPHAA